MPDETQQPTPEPTQPQPSPEASAGNAEPISTPVENPIPEPNPIPVRPDEPMTSTYSDRAFSPTETLPRLWKPRQAFRCGS